MPQTRAVAGSKRGRREAEDREYDQMRRCQTNGHRPCEAAVDGDSVSAAAAAGASPAAGSRQWLLLLLLTVLCIIQLM